MMFFFVPTQLLPPAESLTAAAAAAPEQTTGPCLSTQPKGWSTLIEVVPALLEQPEVLMRRIGINSGNATSQSSVAATIGSYPRKNQIKTKNRNNI